jgi:signal transduction histidine kinase
MKIGGRQLLEHARTYRFELKHVTVLFMVILVFQLILSFLHKASLQKFLVRTQEWYQQDSAERLANLTTTSLELLLEGNTGKGPADDREVRKMVQGLNIILSQQLLNQNVQEVCVLVPTDSSVVAIDDGNVLYQHIFAGYRPASNPQHARAIELYRRLVPGIRDNEQIQTVLEGKQTFHVFVPFVPRGEFMGAVYMRNTPDFSFISSEIISSYDEVALTFSGLILFGLLAMFYIFSYTMKERNEAQQLLFRKEKEHFAEQIRHEKEMLFTKRIYHTHHKAEKVMGFIKEDLRSLSEKNIEEVKDRVIKYSNFIARVIYDMKWYDPPIQTIRGPLFRTDINSVLRFLTRNVFQRVTNGSSRARFEFCLGEGIPAVPVNEFVAWEAFEPIIQNSLEHGNVPDLVITLSTVYDAERQQITVVISDNGVGLREDLLDRDENGVKRLFLDNVSTNTEGGRHSGYGCYIAREIATQRCGWALDAANNEGRGCRFTFTIPSQQ